MHRLFAPQKLLLVGGGFWGESLLEQCEKFGFAGDVWIVHPHKTTIAGKKTYPDLASLPDVPDVAFIGVNKKLTIDLVDALAKMGCGGVVCFASGFAEIDGDKGHDLQQALLQAAGEMPILGPNCYGFINALDRCILWPDHHGVMPCAKGVAILTQSSNIAINLSMQRRGLPIAAIITLGNQAQTTMVDVAEYWLEDERITALGFYIEGIDNPTRWCALAKRAHALNKPLIALKVGTSTQAQAATLSHTASMAGSSAGACALLRRFGITQIETLEVLLEALKIAHSIGWIEGNTISSMSCSGGEASLIADTAERHGLDFAQLSENTADALSDTLGDRVTIANPLDYHTYIWGNAPAMHQTYRAMMRDKWSMTLLVLDYPRTPDAPMWDLAVDSFVTAAQEANCPAAIIASLPENLPETLAQKLIAHGIVPLLGLEQGCAAISAMQRPNIGNLTPPFAPTIPDTAAKMLNEAQSKRLLSHHGLSVPKGQVAQDHAELYNLCKSLKAPYVLKGLGFAHKTEMGAVVVGLENPDQVIETAEGMNTEQFLIEEMITDVIVELLVGITHDPAHGYLLTIGAGGQDTELLQDTVTLSLPATDSEIKQALSRLRVAPKLHGYRGGKGIDIPSLCTTLQQLQQMVILDEGRMHEVEINPLLCTENAIWVVDALINRR